MNALWIIEADINELYWRWDWLGEMRMLFIESMLVLFCGWFFLWQFLLWWQFVRRRNNNVNFSEIRPRSLCCAGCIHEEISLARRFSLAMWREGGSIVTRDFCDQEEKERRNSEWELNWCRYLKCIQKPIPSKYPEIQAKDFQSSQGHD